LELVRVFDQEARDKGTPQKESLTKLSGRTGEYVNDQMTTEQLTRAGIKIDHWTPFNNVIHEYTCSRIPLPYQRDIDKYIPEDRQVTNVDKATEIKGDVIELLATLFVARGRLDLILHLTIGSAEMITNSRTIDAHLDGKMWRLIQNRRPNGLEIHVKSGENGRNPTS
jgi:hypothetical protein